MLIYSCDVHFSGVCLIRTRDTTTMCTRATCEETWSKSTQTLMLHLHDISSVDVRFNYKELQTPCSKIISIIVYNTFYERLGHSLCFYPKYFNKFVPFYLL